jgi:hypothetical protein
MANLLCLDLLLIMYLVFLLQIHLFYEYRTGSISNLRIAGIRKSLHIKHL